MQIGVGIFLRTQRTGGGVSPDAPIAAMFANGEQGAWYDPSDMASMARDGNGTPVTASGQTVALLMDKRLGLARGAELVSNPTFASGTGWNITGADATHTVTFGAGGARYRSDTTTPQLNLSGNLTASTAGAFEVTVVVSAWVSGSVKISETANGNLIIGGVGTFTAILRGAAAAITRNSANVDITIQSISIKPIAGNHAWRGVTAQRPTLMIDGTKNYLAFDGTDDVLVSDSIDMTASTQLTVSAGMRKESDAAIGILAEFSDNLNNRTGSWYVAAPIDPGQAGISFVAKGTNAQYLDSLGFASPVLAVLTAQSSLTTPMANMRVNGVQTATSAGDLGTGTFGNWPLYIGRRGGASNPFTGRLYGLIVRAAASNAGQVASLETYMNGKTGAY